MPAQSTGYCDCYCSDCFVVSLPSTLWNSLLLQEDVIPSILIQLRDVKKGKASQFFGLMGKQVGGE